MDRKQRHRCDQPPIADALFWKGFNPDQDPSFESLTVLEIGCGRGRRCLDIVDRGAARIVGIDPYEKSILEARSYLQQHYPDWRESVTYRCCRIADVPERNFDVIISENAFEHIMDVDAVLASMKDKLKEGGRAYIGFGPLYHSPYGDHGWIRATFPPGLPLPWGHVLLPRSLMMKLLSRHYGQPIENLEDWPFAGLNELTIAEFKQKFQDSGLTIEVFRCNVGYSLIAKIFGLFSKLPFLEKYFTYNLFCILRKEPVHRSSES